MECSHLADILYLLLFLLDTKDIEQLLKIVRAGLPAVVVSFLAQKRLNIFCFWATNRNQLNEPIDAALFIQSSGD